jgi:hypothetical protein
MPENSWVPQIRASKFNKGEAYVVVNNYRQFDFMPYVFRTRDFGETWENILARKPETFGYALSIVQDLEVPNLLFLGTEYGLYISIDEGKNWTKWTHNYPTVSTKDLAIHPREHDLVIGTFGRAAYVLDDIRPFRTLAKEGIETLEKPLHLFTPPNAFITQNQQPTGTRFGANAIFNGENRPRGAMLTYSINWPEDKKEGESSDKKKNKKKKKNNEEPTVQAKKPVVKFDTISLQIFNSKNELIRSLKRKAPKENGIHRMYWYLDEKGAPRPSRRKARKNAPEPSGVTVLPGRYKLKAYFGNQIETQYIDVAYDPRIDMPMDVLQSKYDLLKELEKKSVKVYEASQNLIESKEIVADYQKRIKQLDTDDKYKETLKNHKELLKKIDGLLDELFGKIDRRQGITTSEFPSTTSYLGMAGRYVGNLMKKPGKTEFNLIENADKKLSPVIKAINDFYKTDWPAYQKEVSKLELSPFKKISEINYE